METKPGVLHLKVKDNRRGTLYSAEPAGTGLPRTMMATGDSYSPGENVRVLSNVAFTGSDNKKYFTCENNSTYIRIEDVIVKGTSYTIKPGDTLSAIAKDKYGYADVAYYKKIYNGNPEKLTKGMDHIQANDVIIIPE